MPAPERSPAERVHDYGEIYQTLPEDELREQASRCMDCGVPFCNNACPLGNLIPDWNDLARVGDWKGAIDQLHATNNFPEFTGPDLPGAVRVGLRARHRRRPGDDQADRVLDDQQRLRGGLGRPRAAGDPHRQATSRWSAPAPPEWPRRPSSTRSATRSPSTSGTRPPAGCCASASPTRSSRSGSSTAASTCSSAEGIEFVCDVDVGRDISVDELRAEHDAVVLAIGSRVERDLERPGPRARRRPLRDGLPLPAQPLGRRVAGPAPAASRSSRSAPPASASS